MSEEIEELKKKLDEIIELLKQIVNNTGSYV